MVTGQLVISRWMSQWKEIYRARHQGAGEELVAIGVCVVAMSIQAGPASFYL